MIRPKLSPRILGQQQTSVGTRYLCDQDTFIDCVDADNGTWYYVLGSCVETTLPNTKFVALHLALDVLYNWLNTKDFLAS